MYCKYYGFPHKPFELIPDPDVIFLSETHQEAISILRYGVLNHKGFLQLTGNVGTGKSTLLQSLIQSLDSDVHLCYIPNPNFTVEEFYYFLGAKFGLDDFDGNKAKFIIALSGFLQKCRDRNEHALLIIDEAQVLSLEVLEEIRLISNQEFHDVYGVLSIFLVGQPELNDLLDHRKLLPLRNRIAINFHIEPLSLEETTAYIKFRLRKAGRETVLFSENACREIHHATKGIPRTINILCDNALLTGFAGQRGIIDESIIRDCAREFRKAEKVLLSREKKPEPPQVEEDIIKSESTPEESRSHSAILRPGRIALGIMGLVLFIIAMTATTEYWGSLPGAAPVKTFFEKVNVQFHEKILPSLKREHPAPKAKTGASSAQIRLHSEEITDEPELPEEGKNTEQLIEEKKSDETGNANFAVQDEANETSQHKEKGDTSYFAKITPEVGWANIRSGPSMENEILRAVPANFPLLVHVQNKEWSQVEDYRKKKGWVATRLLAENNTVILQIRRGYLRKKPGLDEDIVKEINYGTVLQVLEVSENWFKVIDNDGVEGWLHKFGVWP